MGKKLHVETVYAWCLNGSPKLGAADDVDDYYKVLVITTTPKITVKRFRSLLGAAFANQGWASFVGSIEFNQMVDKILESKDGYKRAVPIWKRDIYAGTHIWHWQLLGDATLRLGT